MKPGEKERRRERDRERKLRWKNHFKRTDKCSALKWTGIIRLLHFLCYFIFQPTIICLYTQKFLEQKKCSINDQTIDTVHRPQASYTELENKKIMFKKRTYLNLNRMKPKIQLSKYNNRIIRPIEITNSNWNWKKKKWTLFTWYRRNYVLIWREIGF